MRAVMVAVVLIASAVVGSGTPANAESCTTTGFQRDGFDLTAALVNPAGTVQGTLDASGCDIGVFYDGGSGAVQGADISGARYFGVVVQGDANDVAVDVIGSSIHDIGDVPLDGSQHGIAIYYRAFGTGHASGRIAGNTMWNYQKGGIVTNGPGTRVDVRGNVVTGQGPVTWIAQNGIQIGYGASASVLGNTVTGHSYTGTSTVSGGIIVVGGAYYDSALTVGTRIEGNTVRDNDVGVFLSNLDADGGAPLDATNVKVVNNTISNSGLFNDYLGFGYQAGVSDVGNNDKIIANEISGLGYDPAANPSAYTVFIDADPSFTNRPKVHANSE
jgi:hypothetical protein